MNSASRIIEYIRREAEAREKNYTHSAYYLKITLTCGRILSRFSSTKHSPSEGILEGINYEMAAGKTGGSEPLYIVTSEITSIAVKWE